MKWVLAIIVVLPAVALVVGTIRGRVRVRPCCAMDATSDLRMAPAFVDDAPVPTTPPVRGARAAS
jgi:hypothetical protein